MAARTPGTAERKHALSSLREAAAGNGWQTSQCNHNGYQWLAFTRDGEKVLLQVHHWRQEVRQAIINGTVSSSAEVTSKLLG